MKSRTLIFCLAAFSIVLCAANGVEQLVQARGTKAVLSIMRPGDQQIERVQENLKTHYRAAETAMAVIAAQAILIFLLVREKHQCLLP
jgi:hypothetical protein